MTNSEAPDDALSPEVERFIERLIAAVFLVAFGCFTALVVAATYVAVRWLLTLV